MKIAYIEKAIPENKTSCILEQKLIVDLVSFLEGHGNKVKKSFESTNLWYLLEESRYKLLDFTKNSIGCHTY